MIGIMRHGESRATIDPTLFGRTNPETVPLTTFGYQQAVTAGQKTEEYLQETIGISGDPVVIYYSPHLRIKQSVVGFIEGFSDKSRIKNLIEDPRLIERDHGMFDGLSLEQQKAHDPECFRLLYHGTTRQKYETKMPDGESLRDIQLRCQKFVRSAKRIASDHHVIIITHGGFVAALQNTFWEKGVSSWIDQNLPVPPTGTVIAMDTPLISPNSKAIWIGEKRRHPITIDTDAFYPDLSILPKKNIIENDVIDFQNLQKRTNPSVKQRI
jgi:broad specificity phosphatase PhoE